MERIKLEGKLKNCTARGEEAGGFKSEEFFMDFSTPEDLIQLVAPVLVSPQFLACAVQEIILKEYYHAA